MWRGWKCTINAAGLSERSEEQDFSVHSYTIASKSACNLQSNSKQHVTTFRFRPTNYHFQTVTPPPRHLCSAAFAFSDWHEWCASRMTFAFFLYRSNWRTTFSPPPPLKDLTDRVYTFEADIRSFTELLLAEKQRIGHERLCE